MEATKPRKKIINQCTLCRLEEGLDFFEIEHLIFDNKQVFYCTRVSSYEAGLATEVVSVPLSTYVPEKYQSSAPEPSLPWRGRRSTPRCQSAPLLEVLTAKGPAVLVSVPLPVECQKVTEFDEKF